jgi:hypothetical protein
MMKCGKADKLSVFNYEFIQSPNRAPHNKGMCETINEAGVVE